MPVYLLWPLFNLLLGSVWEVRSCHLWSCTSGLGRQICSPVVKSPWGCLSNTRTDSFKVGFQVWKQYSYIVNHLFLGLCLSSLMMALIPSSGLPEDGIRAIFRNVVNFRFLYIFVYVTFYILFTLKTMDKVQETNGSQCYIPPSKPFRIQVQL
jgi:hypothetical protein